jgi:hypothetical protein
VEKSQRFIEEKNPSMVLRISAQFKELLAMTEQYRRKNQYE